MALRILVRGAQSTLAASLCHVSRRRPTIPGRRSIYMHPNGAGLVPKPWGAGVSSPIHRFEKPVKKVFIVKKRNDADALDGTLALSKWCRKHDIDVFVEEAVLSEIPNVNPIKTLGDTPADWAKELDLVCIVGGDGTLLYASGMFNTAMPPCVPFSCGSLGFLLPFDLDKYAQVMTDIISNRSRLLQRARVEFFILRPGEKEEQSNRFQVLNEVVLKRSQIHLQTATARPLSGVVDLECLIDGNLLARFQGDGLIISSTTGSTAYSMAAHGPICHPSINCLLLTPLCSMTLSSRPLVLPGNSTITLRPLSNRVLLEGRNGRELDAGDTVVVRKSRFPLMTFCRDDCTQDWVQDLGSRLLYERQVRVQRTPRREALAKAEDDMVVNAVPK